MSNAEAEAVLDTLEVSNIISYVDPQDGRTYYSFDDGGSFVPLTEEEFEQRFPTPDVEWWTYEEYAAWLEKEKKELQGMIGERGWTGGRGEFVWTQEIVDETIAVYEEILQDIKNGLQVSRSVNGMMIYSWRTIRKTWNWALPKGSWSFPFFCPTANKRCLGLTKPRRNCLLR